MVELSSNPLIKLVGNCSPAIMINHVPNATHTKHINKLRIGLSSCSPSDRLRANRNPIFETEGLLGGLLASAHVIFSPEVKQAAPGNSCKEDPNHYSPKPIHQPQNYRHNYCKNFLHFSLSPFLIDLLDFPTSMPLYNIQQEVQLSTSGLGCHG